MPHKVTAYLTVEVTRSSWSKNSVTGQYNVERLRVTGVRKERPITPADGEVVEVNLEFPDGYFDDNVPSVTIAVPDNPASKPTTVQATVVKAKRPSAAASVLQP